MAASATSYASSTVCGTIVRAVCSRSHGQSRRSRSVRCCRARSASASPASCGTEVLAGRGRRRRRRRRLESGLVLDRTRLGEVRAEVLRPLLADLGLLRLRDDLLDLRLDRRERRLLLRLHGRERLDDVPAELRLDRLRDVAGLDREGDLVEWRHRLALREVAQLAARLLRARVL